MFCSPKTPLEIILRKNPLFLFRSEFVGLVGVKVTDVRMHYSSFLPFQLFKTISSWSDALGLTYEGTKER